MYTSVKKHLAHITLIKFSLGTEKQSALICIALFARQYSRRNPFT